MNPELPHSPTDINSQHSAEKHRLRLSDELAIAKAVFPHFAQLETLDDLETRFPPRELPRSAYVTRVGPSPTGMMHIGGLYAALINHNLALHSGGKFFLRVEDTDQQRIVDGATDTIIEALQFYELSPDEGPLKCGEMIKDRGNYGPYIQTSRLKIYQAVAFNLIAQGHLYPCFLEESSLERIRALQDRLKLPIGIYGEYASSRGLSALEILAKIERGTPFTLRFRSPQSSQISPQQVPGEQDKINWVDLIRGELRCDSNFVDAVMFKSNGIPTYHFAHLVDDHFMRTTHVIRGEEWLSSVPLHLQLFSAAGWAAPLYGHIAPICKLDGSSRRKLSKRKDPEADLRYYWEQGFPPQALREYLTNLANSNFEEWRERNPQQPTSCFKIVLSKMCSMGPLVDVKKLENISRDTLFNMPLEELRDQVLEWTAKFEPRLAEAFGADTELLLRSLAAERDVKGTSGKRLVTLRDIKEHIAPFFDSLVGGFEAAPLPSLSPKDMQEIIELTRQELPKMNLAEELFPLLQRVATFTNFAPTMKEYKSAPQNFKGHIGDIAALVRIALFRSTRSPDLGQIAVALGTKSCLFRLKQLSEHLDKL